MTFSTVHVFPGPPSRSSSRSPFALFLPLRAASSIAFANVFFSARAVSPSLSRLSLAFLFFMSPSPVHLSYFSPAPPPPLCLCLSLAETFPQTPLRRHSRLVYPPTSIRIPVACYIMAYQLFCQFPVRASNEWDFFLCFFHYFARWNYRSTLAVSLTRTCARHPLPSRSTII